MKDPLAELSALTVNGVGANVLSGEGAIEMYPEEGGLVDEGEWCVCLVCAREDDRLPTEGPMRP